jgi:hypothetical protein
MVAIKPRNKILATLLPNVKLHSTLTPLSRARTTPLR